MGWEGRRGDSGRRLETGGLAARSEVVMLGVGNQGRPACLMRRRRSRTSNMHALFLRGVPPGAGEDEVEQLACMMEVVGLPPVSLLEAASRRKLFFDSAGNPRLQPNSQGRTRMPGTKTLQVRAEAAG